MSPPHDHVSVAMQENQNLQTCIHESSSLKAPHPSSLRVRQIIEMDTTTFTAIPKFVVVLDNGIAHASHFVSSKSSHIEYILCLSCSLFESHVLK
jgi:hypothetical protein